MTRERVNTRIMLRRGQPKLRASKHDYRKACRSDGGDSAPKQALNIRKVPSRLQTKLIRRSCTRRVKRRLGGSVGAAVSTPGCALFVTPTSRRIYREPRRSLTPTKETMLSCCRGGGESWLRSASLVVSPTTALRAVSSKLDYSSYALATAYHEDSAFHFDVLFPMLCYAERQRGTLPRRFSSAAFSFEKGCAHSFCAEQRKVVVEWLAKYHTHFGMAAPCLFLAVRLLDQVFKRWMAVGVPLMFRIYTCDTSRSSGLPRELTRFSTLLGSAILMLAGKFEDDCIRPLDLTDIVGDLFTLDDLLKAELLLLSQLEYRLHVPTTFNHLSWFAKLCDNCERRYHHEAVTNYLAELSLRCATSSNWLPSQHAAAVVVAANHILSLPLMPSSLQAALSAGEDAADECWPVALDNIVRFILIELNDARPGDKAFDKYWQVSALLVELLGQLHRPYEGVASSMSSCSVSAPLAKRRKICRVQ